MAVTFVYGGLKAEDTMKFEAIYHPSIGLSVGEKRTELKKRGRLWVWMYDDEELVGETFGYSMRDAWLPKEIEPGVRTMYCASNTTIPQGKGYGTIIKAHWLGLVKASGFERVIGHARAGASEKLNEKFRALFVKDEPNWWNTGETYRLYELML